MLHVPVHFLLRQPGRHHVRPPGVRGVHHGRERLARQRGLRVQVQRGQAGLRGGALQGAEGAQPELAARAKGHRAKAEAG